MSVREEHCNVAQHGEAHGAARPGPLPAAGDVAERAKAAAAAILQGRLHGAPCANGCEYKEVKIERRQHVDHFAQGGQFLGSFGDRDKVATHENEEAVPYWWPTMD